MLYREIQDSSAKIADVKQVQVQETAVWHLQINLSS